MGRGTRLWASPDCDEEDEGEPAKETEEEWPGCGARRERHPEAKMENILRG